MITLQNESSSSLKIQEKHFILINNTKRDETMFVKINASDSSIIKWLDIDNETE